MPKLTRLEDELCDVDDSGEHGIVGALEIRIAPEAEYSRERDTGLVLALSAPKSHVP
jgi:hypothetical protein